MSQCIKLGESEITLLGTVHKINRQAVRPAELLSLSN